MQNSSVGGVPKDFLKGVKIEILDHGFAQLVDYMGCDLSIVRGARVSFDADWRAGHDTGSDERLINYLWSHRHTSPFEMVQFSFHVKAPIFVFRHWHRHRTWSYNELSARYSPLPAEFYIPDLDVIGEQSKSNKQARALGQVRLGHRIGRLLMIAHSRGAYALYQFLLWLGWPRELARIVLPLNVYSRMFGSVNLLNLLRFLTLRDHDHTQWETRQYAIALLRLVRPLVPVAAAAWEQDRANK